MKINGVKIKKGTFTIEVPWTVRSENEHHISSKLVGTIEIKCAWDGKNLQIGRP